MTVSPDARTPSAPVHALSGSSAGPGRPFAPIATLHELPDPFVPLGDAAAGAVAGLAARRSTAHPDAAVIDLATRLAALAPRQERVHDRALVIQGRHDAWSYANRPKAPAQPPSEMVLTDLSTATHSVMQFTQPLAVIEARRRELDAHKVAIEAHERRLERKITGSRNPYLMKLADRMWNRMYRWACDLAEMEPLTQEGLTAKTAAAVAVTKTVGEDQWGRALTESVNHDAVRLASSSSSAGPDHDAELLGLLGRWTAAQAAWDATMEPFDAAMMRAHAACPPRPDALWWRGDDLGRPLGGSATGQEPRPNDRMRLFYLPRDVEQMRAAGPVTRWARVADDHPGPPPREVDPDGEARRQEIIAAHDGWMAARAAVDDAVGYTAASEAAQKAAEALNDVEDAVKLCQPRTVAGLVAKAAWVVDLVSRDACDVDLPEVFARQVAAFGRATPPAGRRTGPASAPSADTATRAA